MAIWHDIPGTEGRYKINPVGEIMSSVGIVKGAINAYGYPVVIIYLNGKYRTCQRHRLLAQQYIPNPQNKPQVNHKNGIKTDYRISNLEWCTAKENTRHAIENGAYKCNIKPKPIIQTTIDGILVANYPSMSSAPKEFKQSGISHCCRGITKQYKGFIWKYAY